MCVSVQPTHTPMCGGDTGTPTCCSIRRSATRTHPSCPKRAESASWGKRLRTLHCEWTSNYIHILSLSLIMYHYIHGESSYLFIHEKHLGTAIIICPVSLFPRSAPSSPDVSPQSSPRPPRANNDRLTLLTRLVRKGEKKGLFVEKMPASIYQVKLASSCLTGSNLEVQRYKVCVYTTLTFILSVMEEAPGSSGLSVLCLCRWWEMRISSSWGTETSTTATTSTSPSRLPPSMQYVLLYFSIFRKQIFLSTFA